LPNASICVHLRHLRIGPHLIDPQISQMDADKGWYAAFRTQLHR